MKMKRMDGEFNPSLICWKTTHASVWRECNIKNCD